MSRVLISAYACAPGRGSEPGVGWNSVMQVARVHEVWVLLPENERAAVEKAIRTEPAERVQFVFCDLPRLIRFSNQNTTVRFALHYYAWQLQAYRVARRLHARYGFDLVHHLTLGAYWKPSLLGLLPIPFLFGPLGGGECLPRGFGRFLPWRGRLFEIARMAAQRASELDPLVRLTVRRSALAISKTVETRRRLRLLGARQTLVLSEAAIPAEEMAWLESMPARKSEIFRILSLGRLLHWKGFELSLRAFARFHADFPASEYWLIGDGPSRKRLEAVAAALGVSQSVRFFGNLPRREALARLAECDILVHPSLHDSGGWVCLEAMAAGRPVVCLDVGGPGVQVDDDTGIKVRAEWPEQAIRDLGDAFLQLSGDPLLRERLGRAARIRVREMFSWEVKGRQLLSLYSQLLPAEQAGHERGLFRGRANAGSGRGQ
ncbi:MAG TPA: glycosyltransferase family 4 protein [Bryobacteraceae bacterium]|nr:glycosyltransferase family 4 protein [Bryobacteraceae bacterium]